MADSTENNNNLDSYGVWVKRPPQDANTEATDVDLSDLDNMFADSTSMEDPVVADDATFDTMSDNDTTLSDEELSNITSDINLPEKDATIIPDDDDMFGDLPDFSSDAPAETSAETQEAVAVDEEFSIDDFMDGSEEAPSFEEPAETSPEAPAEESTEVSFDAEDGEISLDDFMDGGFTDPNPGAETAAPAPTSDSDDGEISLDDFMDGGFTDPNPGAEMSESSTDEISLDDFLDDDSSKEKEDDVTNDEALDIDLSFTESEENQVETEDSESFESEDNIEDNMFADEPAAETSSVSSESFEAASFDTEEISLEDFGLDENSDDASAVAAGAAVNASADSEEVDLSDFGIDSDAGETPVKQDVQSAKKKQVVDYDLAITEEDTVAQAPTAETVPDILSQETSDLEDANFDEATVQNPNATMVDNSILDQIMAELSGLKNEINSLKGEFEDLKSKEPAPVVVPVPTPSENTFDEAPAEENTGFFDADDGDDTIALSGDELSNIMNTADFTETNDTASDNFEIPEENNEEISETLPDDIAAQIDSDTTEPDFDSIEEDNISESTESSDFPIEETIDEPVIEAPVETGLSMSSETLEEPNFDDFNASADEEVTIPTVDEIAADESDSVADDILVESSNTDLMNSVNDSTEQMAEMSEMANSMEETVEAVQETAESESIPSVDDIAENEILDTTGSDEVVEEGYTSDSTELTESNSEQDAIYNEIMTEDEDVSSISDESIDYLKDEPVADPTSEGAIEEVVITETPDEEPAEETAPDTSALPDDLKSDVKSVLLYMDQLLENLPEDKIMEFAKSEQFSTYKKLFSELGLS